MIEPLGQTDVVAGTVIVFLALRCFLVGRIHKLMADSFALHLLAPLWTRAFERCCLFGYWHKGPGTFVSSMPAAKQWDCLKHILDCFAFKQNARQTN